MMGDNYENTLLGQYIRAIENPDSVGYQNGRWYKPRNKRFDPNNRGFGIDVRYNDAAEALTRGRPGRWLTTQEERDLRNGHIKEARNKQDEYYPFLRKYELSEAKKILGTGLLYRGDGINENKKLSDAYYNGTDEDFQKAVSDYYKSKGLNERASRSDQFMENYKHNQEHPIFDQDIEDMPQFDFPFRYGDVGSITNPVILPAVTIKGHTINNTKTKMKSKLIPRHQKGGETQYNEAIKRSLEISDSRPHLLGKWFRQGMRKIINQGPAYNIPQPVNKEEEFYNAPYNNIVSYYWTPNYNTG